LPLKILWLLVLAACASHHADDFSNRPAFTITKDMSYEEAAKGKGALGKCLEFGEDRYCQWGEDAPSYFKNNKYVKDLAKKTTPVVMNMNIVSLKGPEQIDKTAVLVSHRRSPQSIEWRRYLPMLTKMLNSADYAVTTDPAAAKQQIVIDFGVKPLSRAQVNRHLNVSSFAQGEAGHKGTEIWKIELSSLGSIRDLRRLMPIMVATAHNLIMTNQEINEQRNVSENDLEVLAFVDQLEKK
jgi:hypothetical protein